VTPPEPVTVTAPRPITRPVLRQEWRDVAFLHWRVDPEPATALLPRGIALDLYDGGAYVGLVAFRVRRTAVFTTLPLPYAGDFDEVNVRLYSVDPAGRRGVVFLSLDASRLAAVLAARTVGVPYRWARTRVTCDRQWYATSRRYRGGVGCRVLLDVGAPIPRPSPLELFLTARWGLHLSRGGRTLYWPNEHPPWQLHTAQAVEVEEDLVAATGLPGPDRPPDSVLYSPGVPAQFGPPRATLRR
jgi:uncharacterized protein YqjF (DUF2071 family)